MVEQIQDDIEPRLILWVFPAVLSSSSNGHRSMAYMIHMLVQRGYPCGVLVPSISRFKQLSTLQLPNGVFLIKNEHPPKSSLCVVAPDTADPYFIETLRSYGHRVLWWLMAPPVLLGSPFPKVQANDSVAIYSSFVLPDHNDYCFVQDPSCFQQISVQKYSNRLDTLLKPSVRCLRVGIYCGKARLTLLSQVLESFLSGVEIVPFSRNWPSGRSDYNELINSLDGLICFDPLTAVILDIVAQAKPVFLPNNPFPLSAYEDFPLSCLRLVYTDDLQFLSQFRSCPSGWIGRNNSIHDEIETANDKGFHLFIKMIENLYPNRANAYYTQSITAELQSYVDRLEVVSTIDPCLDGQAASAEFLWIYLRILALPHLIRGWMRRILLLMLNTSDRLAHLDCGRFVLRLTIYLPSTLRALQARISWIVLSIYQKWLLPAIRRAFAA
ncbi:hypothetical protein KBY72_12105 [Cyanobium sp. BA5m-21]|uniref:hypothetical protein n=1 Tax=unclassified Cyanobium TaxID=2627006 RepID=UPI0020CD586D|nr:MULTISPECIES: hypothetical protein [unclassified Cyanobium]MCP9904715.1 hypothetical protein [Cyanobium sp. BA5m-10]MCP9907909.1 hypothetical protein [Cyanobium sp. BA5m-21]